MRSYVGIDAHSNTGLELAAIDGDGGELLWRDRTRLNAEELREAVGQAQDPCTVVFEQGELATWLYLVLSELCDRLVAADPRHNRLIATSPDKDDAFDAKTLAELAKGRYIREIYQPPEEFLELRLEVRHHRRLVRHVTRLKNQIKSLFRQQGIVAKGKRVYSPDRRQSWLSRMLPAARPAAADLLAMLDAASDRREAALQRLGKVARRFPPVSRIMGVPQIGPVTAATFVGYVVTLERFPSRSHLWSYCGFGLTRRQSGSRAEPVRLRSRFNRHVKHVIKSAVERLVAEDPSTEPFAAAYRARLERGTLPNRAKLSIARKLIDVLCALWRNDAEYDPERVSVG